MWETLKKALKVVGGLLSCPGGDWAMTPTSSVCCQWLRQGLNLNTGLGSPSLQSSPLCLWDRILPQDWIQAFSPVLHLFGKALRLSLCSHCCPEMLILLPRTRLMSFLAIVLVQWGLLLGFCWHSSPFPGFFRLWPAGDTFAGILPLWSGSIPSTENRDHVWHIHALQFCQEPCTHRG